jgi:hypothetical protein
MRGRCRLWPSLALGVAAVGASACQAKTAPFADTLCNRDLDCAGYMACEDGRCVAVENAECSLSEQCTTPGTCQQVAGALCYAGRCHYAALSCASPPSNACADSDSTFVSYPTTGVCDLATGACDYTPTRIACALCATTCLPVCAGVQCDDLQGGCRSNGTCLPYTPPTCHYQEADLGSACSLPGEVAPTANGLCLGGACTTCLSDGDCPGAAVACDDPTATTSCQGRLGVGRCHAKICSIEWVDNDSACAGAVRLCLGNFKAVTCTADASQPVATCASTCTGNGDCLEGFACNGGSCTCRIGDLCSDPDPCHYNGQCQSDGGCLGTPVTANNGCQSDTTPCGKTRACNGTATCTEQEKNGATCPAPKTCSAGHCVCARPWGGTVTHGTVVTGYSSASAYYPATCQSKTATCNEGVLALGAYTQSSCLQGCATYMGDYVQCLVGARGPYTVAYQFLAGACITPSCDGAVTGFYNLASGVVSKTPYQCASGIVDEAHCTAPTDTWHVVCNLTVDGTYACDGTHCNPTYYNVDCTVPPRP